MVICNRCKGKGKEKDFYGYHNDYEWVTCRVCDGKTDLPPVKKKRLMLTTPIPTEVAAMHVCPSCGSDELWRDEVDVGVGVITGPYGCPYCGWSERSDYDQSSGFNEASRANPEWYVDQWGRAMRIAAIADRCEQFGLDRTEVEAAFREQIDVTPQGAD